LATSTSSLRRFRWGRDCNRWLVDGFETGAGAGAGETDRGESGAVSADGGPHAADGRPGSADDTTPDERT
jgi:hypothetical protein